MRNDGFGREARGSSPALSEKTLHRWYGYHDAANGLGFRKEYESMTLYNQNNYERGRQYAVIVKSYLGFVPRWKKNQKLSTVMAPFKANCQALTDSIQNDYGLFFKKKA